MTTRFVSLAAVSVLTLGLVACGQADQPTVPSPSPGATVTQAPEATDQPTPATTQTPASDVDEHNAAALRAIATAAQSENGTAYAIDDEDDDNTWEVDVMVGDRSIEVKISADGNTVISRDDDAADADDRARLARAQITLTQAIEAALVEVPGRLDDADLDEEDGQDVWEVSIDIPGNDDVDVYVSTQDARIIKVDR